MEDKDLQEFSLDDILKEFGTSQEESSPEPADDLLPEEVLPTQEVPPEEELTELPEEQPEGPAVASAVTGDTIRMDPIRMPKGSTQLAQPIEEEPPQEEAPKKAEPFTESWEPEYEQPMGEYVPPQPIQFQPRSRMRDLKRALIAGPEKRYYVLVEQGLGKLQVMIFLSFLVVAAAAFTTFLHATGAVSPNRMRLLIFCQLMVMLLSALFGCFQLLEGLADLGKKRFTLNTLLFFTFVACTADAIACLQQLRVPCCAAFSLEMLMSQWSEYQHRHAEMGMMDTLRKANRLDAVCAQKAYWGKAKGLLRRPGQVAEFMDTYQKPSTPENILNWYALGTLVASLGIGAAAYYLVGGLEAALQVTAVCLLAGLPATSFITLSRPMAVLERRLHKLGIVLCGWQGIRGLSGKAVFPVDQEDLCPASSVKMNGVKFFGSRDPDEVVAYATALITADGSSLAPVFTQVLDSRNGRYYDAENYRTYSGGIGCEICGDPVLAGNPAFLRDMGVEVPEGVRVNNAVYVAVDGELSGLFALSFEKSASTLAGLATLCGHVGIRPILSATDFSLTEGAIKSRLGVRLKKLLIPTLDERQELTVEATEEQPALLMSTRPGLAPMAYGVTGARALRTASILGVIVHLLGGILGLGIMLALVLFGALDLLTPANLFAYQLIWVIPGLLLTFWTKSF